MIKNFIGHLKTVLKHKRCVAHYCFMCGLYIQGILHDMSKFSFVEFFESVKYYQGTSSPINACKDDIGYSNAWFHHKGRNKHHWEYWVDDFEKGVIPKKMPYKYVLEMICDYLGAGRGYMGDKFTMAAEYKWWVDKRKVVLMHEDTKKMVDIFFHDMNNKGIEQVLKNKRYIKKWERIYKRGF
jgi:hypothetical protein